MILFTYAFYLDRRLENLERIRARAEETLFSSLPVNDIPDVLHIRSFAVQVLNTVNARPYNSEFEAYLQVVRVLPHINTEDWDFALANNGILILCCDDSKPLLLTGLDLDEPAPATALYAQQRCVERLLELVLVTPYRLDLPDELGGRGALCFGRACWSQILPEERVVDMPTSVELDALLERDLRRDVGSVHSLSLTLECSIQIRDVRLVVLAMVQLHDLGGDVGFQCLPNHECIAKKP